MSNQSLNNLNKQQLKQLSELSDQLGWCIESKGYLKDLHNNIKQSQKSLNDVINDLCFCSFSEYTTQFLPHTQEFDKEIKKVSNLIATNHIPYLKDNIAVIQQELGKLGINIPKINNESNDEFFDID